LDWSKFVPSSELILAFERFLREITFLSKSRGKLEEESENNTMLSCGCNHPPREHYMSVIPRGDIILDIDRNAVRSYESNPQDSEVAKEREISEKFIIWRMEN
jgi:hypothetical protein